jgi:hypothetical protein
MLVPTGCLHCLQSDSVTLQVDVVHHPDTVSEFTPHAPQTLAVDAAHYHFDTAPGVRVDAQALLDSLAGAGSPGMEGEEGSCRVMTLCSLSGAAHMSWASAAQLTAYASTSRVVSRRQVWWLHFRWFGAASNV